MSEVGRLGGVTRAVAAGTVAASVLAGVACGRLGRPPAPAPQAFRVCLEASPRLNWFDGRAHALAVRFFRLADGDAFDQTDASQLLRQEVSLPGAVGAPLERTISPGTTLSVDVPRKPDVESVGLVAAYTSVTGARKLREDLAAANDARDHGGSGCIRLGADGIEGP